MVTEEAKFILREAKVYTVGIVAAGIKSNTVPIDSFQNFMYS